MAVELGEAMARCDSGGETKTRPKLRGRVREQQSAGHSNRAINRALHIRRHAGTDGRRGDQANALTSSTA